MVISIVYLLTLYNVSSLKFLRLMIIHHKGNPESTPIYLLYSLILKLCIVWFINRQKAQNIECLKLSPISKTAWAALKNQMKHDCRQNSINKVFLINSFSTGIHYGILSHHSFSLSDTHASKIPKRTEIENYICTTRFSFTFFNTEVVWFGDWDTYR